MYWDGLFFREQIWTGKEEMRQKQKQLKLFEQWKYRNRIHVSWLPTPSSFPQPWSKLQVTHSHKQQLIMLVQTLVLSKFTLRIHPGATMHSLSFHPPNSSASLFKRRTLLKFSQLSSGQCLRTDLNFNAFREFLINCGEQKESCRRTQSSQELISLSEMKEA